MSSYIRELLVREIPISVTPQRLKDLNRIVLKYELRKEHPYVLNSSLLAVNKITFTEDDRRAIFDLFDVDEKDVRKAILTLPPIRVKIDERTHKNVDITKFKVGGDSLNIFVMWVVHHILIAPKISQRDKTQALTNLLNYWQYRFFSSAVNYYFPYAAKRDVMQYVIENLNLKFSIKRLDTWKNVIQERSESLLLDKKDDKQGIHVDSLTNFDDDESIVYAITDNSTRIRSQLQNIMELYYEFKRQSDFIDSTSAITELDGEKMLKEVASSFENLTNQIFTKMLYKQSFVNDNYIKQLVGLFPTLNFSILKRTIIVACDAANTQVADETQNRELVRKNGEVRYEGFELLIDKIIYAVYSRVVKDKRINLSNKLAIFMKAKSVMGVHRVSNVEVLHVKDTLKEFIITNKISRRDATVSALANAFSLYIILVSFEYYKRR